MLSKDAKFFGSSMFWLMEPGKGKLTFMMVESRPSPRSQAALDELVAAGFVKSEPFNQFGGVTYTPLIQFKRPGKQPEGDWPVTVKVTPTEGATNER